VHFRGSSLVRRRATRRPAGPPPLANSIHAQRARGPNRTPVDPARRCGVPDSPLGKQTRAAFAFGFGFAPRVGPASPRLTPTSPPFDNEQDTVTSMVIPLAFAATGATLLVKGLDDLSYGKNKKEGF